MLPDHWNVLVDVPWFLQCIVQWSLKRVVEVKVNVCVSAPPGSVTSLLILCDSGFLVSGLVRFDSVRQTVTHHQTAEFTDAHH